jgi:hypothetical protein
MRSLHSAHGHSSAHFSTTPSLADLVAVPVNRVLETAATHRSDCQALFEQYPIRRIGVCALVNIEPHLRLLPFSQRNEHCLGRAAHLISAEAASHDLKGNGVGSSDEGVQRLS